MDRVRRYWPFPAADEQRHKYAYAPLGTQKGDEVPLQHQKGLWQRKHSLLVVMLVLLGGMAFVLATG